MIIGRTTIFKCYNLYLCDNYLLFNLAIVFGYIKSKHKLITIY